jgi:hypothetical protein
MSIPEGLEAALGFGFMDAIFTRRSRRFGLGMEIKEGTLSHKSRHAPVPLSELKKRSDMGRYGDDGFLGRLALTTSPGFSSGRGGAGLCSCN